MPAVPDLGPVGCRNDTVTFRSIHTIPNLKVPRQVLNPNLIFNANHLGYMRIPPKRSNHLNPDLNQGQTHKQETT